MVKVLALKREHFEEWLSSLPPDEPLPKPQHKDISCPITRWQLAQGVHEIDVGWDFCLFAATQEGVAQEFFLPTWARVFTRAVDKTHFPGWNHPASRVLSILRAIPKRPRLKTPGVL